MKNSVRQRPPYARQAEQTLKFLQTQRKLPRGRVIAVFLGSDAFDRCKSWQSSLYGIGVVLPANSDPLGYDWRIVARFHVLAFGTVALSVQQRLGMALLRDGAALVVVADDDGEIAVYRPESRHAA